MHKVGHIVVQIGKSNPILGTNGLPDNDFVDVIKLVPVFVTKNGINLIQPNMEGLEVVLPHVVIFD